MALLPIDLQTLFSQMDKVGKAHTAATEGAQIQQSVQNAAEQRKNETRIRSVNEAPTSGDGADKVSDKKKRQRSASGAAPGPTEDEKTETEESREEIVRDPDLGRNIDVSG